MILCVCGGVLEATLAALASIDAPSLTSALTTALTSAFKRLTMAIRGRMT